MTKRMTILLAAALALGVARADNQITLSTGEGHPGDEVTVSLSMSGTDPVAGLDMKLPLPDELAYVAGSAALSARCPGHQVSASTVDGTLRLVVYTLSLSDITGTEGDVLSFRLKLGDKPLTQPLQPTVVLGNAEGTSLPVSVTPGQVTILCPELTIDSPQIDFGHIPIRSVYTGSLALRNSGNEPLTIHSLTSDSPIVAVETDGEVISPGDTRYFTVTFSPVQRGAFASKITVDCNAVNRLIYNRLQTAEVVADPFSVNELHLERVEGASGTVATVNLRMNNMEPITGLQATIRLPEGVDYVESSARLSDRASGHQMVGTLNDRELTLLGFSATNQPFADDDGLVASFDVELNARSGWYYLSPENVKLANATADNMTSAVYGEYVVIQSPTISGDDCLDFGEQDVTAELTATYRVENQGQAPLTIERITFLADGFSVKTPLPLSIQPWESAELEIAYNTATPGDFATTMNIYSNDPEMRLKTVALSGRAYSPNSLSISGSYDESTGYDIAVALYNHAQITALQFDLLVDDPVAVGSQITVTPTSRLDGYSTVASRIADGHFRVIAYVISDKTIAGNSGEVMTLHLPLGQSLPDELGVTLQKMVLSSTDSQNLLSPDASASCSISTFGRGDANADRKVSIGDVTAIVNYLNGESPERFSQFGADANADGQVTIGDATTVINQILQ